MYCQQSWTLLLNNGLRISNYLFFLFIISGFFFITTQCYVEKVNDPLSVSSTVSHQLPIQREYESIIHSRTPPDILKNGTVSWKRVFAHQFLSLAADIIFISTAVALKKHVIKYGNDILLRLLLHHIIEADNKSLFAVTTEYRKAQHANELFNQIPLLMPVHDSINPVKVLFAAETLLFLNYIDKDLINWAGTEAQWTPRKRLVRKIMSAVRRSIEVLIIFSRH